MDEKTEKIVTAILYTALIVIFAYVLFGNLKEPWAVIFLSCLLILSITVRNAMIYPSEKYRWSGKIFVLGDILLIFAINLLDRSGSSRIYYFILIGDIAFAYSYRFSAFITAVSYIAYACSFFLVQTYRSMAAFAAYIAFHSLAFLCVYAVMFIAKYETGQRQKLRQAMFELKVKSKQLENTYIKLKDTSEELEEMTILKERNRIAREIHDTVGHTLTTVLLEMEAGERLMKVNPGLAVEKIRLAKGQVRKGLNDIRESVRTLQTGREIMDFKQSVLLLIEETTKHGDVFIKYEISDMPGLTDAQEKALYRALQEGLTNGIRHGKSTAFVFKLLYEGGRIRFFLQDNGVGTDKIVQGFGLTAMEERIRDIGGVFTIDSKKDEGCCIRISVPVSEERENGEYTDFSSR